MVGNNRRLKQVFVGLSVLFVLDTLQVDVVCSAEKVGVVCITDEFVDALKRDQAFLGFSRLDFLDLFNLPGKLLFNLLELHGSCLKLLLAHLSQFYHRGLVLDPGSLHHLRLLFTLLRTLPSIANDFRAFQLLLYTSSYV